MGTLGVAWGQFGDTWKVALVTLRVTWSSMGAFGDMGGGDEDIWGLLEHRGDFWVLGRRHWGHLGAVGRWHGDI